MVIKQDLVYFVRPYKNLRDCFGQYTLENIEVYVKILGLQLGKIWVYRLTKNAGMVSSILL